MTKCYYCNNSVSGGTNLCDKHREKKRADRKLQYQRRKDAGLCTMCGKEKEQQKNLQCSMCNNKQHDAYLKRRAKRLKDNICTQCARDMSIISCWTNTRCPGCHFREKFKWDGTKEDAEQIINNMLEKQNYRCVLTGRDLKTNKFHIDHIIPRSIEPDKIDDPENWQLIVEDANFFKKDKRTEDVFAVAVDMVKYAIECKKLSISDL